MPLYLASNSPRRRELLGLTGLPFTVAAAQVDERPHSGEPAADYVHRLAQEKARAAAGQAPAGSLVLAADTTVADGALILGKPADPAEATRMLRQLRGRIHQVYTGVALFQPESGQMLVEVCATDVPMRDYSEAELAAYVASGDPLDKAGAYAIQHAGFHPVTQLAGCFANVMGLPLCHLARALQQAALPPVADVPTACQAALGYHCPVYAQILAPRAAHSAVK
jgi:MAF protein